MILSDREIHEEINRGRIKISDMVEGAVGPASVDLHLGDTLVLDGEESQHRFVFAHILPLEFMLATTREVVTLPDNIMAQVHGCSSIGRTGLFVQNAGLIDPGFSGMITLELFNSSSEPMRLEPGMRICQVSFAYLSSPCVRPYGQTGRYMNQRGATAPRAARATPPEPRAEDQ